MGAEKDIAIQGRQLKTSDITWIKDLIVEHSDWNRTRISREICREWNWRNAKGVLKDMACRTMLLKLDRQGWITLPPPQVKNNNAARLSKLPLVELDQTPFDGKLKDLLPLKTMLVQSRSESLLFNSILKHHHYLSYRTPVGQNIKYLAFNRQDRVLACLLFGAAAWKTAARDSFIGWNIKIREKNLHLVVNNMRFLILPWFSVGNLASHILGLVSRRIGADWRHKYGHPIHLLETFVETPRFTGHCYRAANWQCVGETTGRTRNDRFKTIQTPVKKIYLYPLHQRFQHYLNK